MKKRKINKKSIISLILISIVFTNSYLLAKYVSAIDGNSSPKNIAKWNVECVDCDVDNPKSLSLIAGNDTLTQSYTIKVKSTSEVSASYQIILNNVPNVMKVSIDSNNDADFVSPINNKIIFESSNYKINVNDNTKQKEHILTFKIPIDSDIESDNNIDVDLKFDQID